MILGRDAFIRVGSELEESIFHYRDGRRGREDYAVSAVVRGAGRGVLEADTNRDAGGVGPRDGDAAGGHGDGSHDR